MGSRLACAHIVISHPLARTLDRVVVAVLVILVVVLLIPDIIGPLGLSALAYIGLGYLLPGLLERVIKKAAETLHLLSLYVALVGLLLHAMLDGAGLAGSELREGSGLAAAIILHRFGMGLMLWLIMYLVVGCVTAAVTMYVFPPIEGFRPRFFTVVSACTVFILLWPILAILALWYQALSFTHRRHRVVSPQRRQEAITEHVGSVSAKPRL